MATETTGSGVATRMVRFGNAVEAFVAAPDRAGSHPCVILLHERYGLFQHTRDLAVRFAGEGYVCLAPDLFSRRDDREVLLSGEKQVPLSDPEVVDDLRASIAFLAGQQRGADMQRLAVMGVCQTGRHPLLFAAHEPAVRAALVFYGGAQSREWEVHDLQPEPYEALLARLNCPVLGVFGEGDHIIPVDDVRRLRGVLEQHRKSYHIRIFRDVPHGWLNDTMPGRYRREAAEEAWRLAQDFLARVWNGGYPADRVHWHFESDIAADYDPSRNRRQA
jgi:carboxymethylenebutenolidase